MYTKRSRTSGYCYLSLAHNVSRPRPGEGSSSRAVIVCNLGRDDAADPERVEALRLAIDAVFEVKGEVACRRAEAACRPVEESLALLVRPACLVPVSDFEDVVRGLARKAGELHPDPERPERPYRITAGGVKLDGRIAWVDGRKIVLSDPERDVLAALMAARRALTRAEILAAASAKPTASPSWANGLIARIRHKLGVPSVIETIHGVGYVFRRAGTQELAGLREKAEAEAEELERRRAESSPDLVLAQVVADVRGEA